MGEAESWAPPPEGDPPIERAAFVVRALAAFIDWVLWLVSGYLLTRVLGSGSGTILLVLLLLPTYFAVLEGRPTGQTLGKWAMDIRVVDASTGLPIGYGRSSLRAFGRIVSWCVFGLGYWWALWDPQKQAWHDVMAGTVVIPTNAEAP